ncbi:hypothetical protein VMT65_05155 [Nocardia sp. CDC153]|uniref:hypothetical protein n=1 Tax=Nocardia sp. CDC153 TaxID=3112167 RepID=UPI002DBE4D29|nr:hypothetical protein [Nocardia sp. CDC153]MEC3952417.1 hypothetical protein [Nocardia sp. CDC153]
MKFTSRAVAAAAIAVTACSVAAGPAVAAEHDPTPALVPVTAVSAPAPDSAAPAVTPVAAAPAAQTIDAAPADPQAAFEAGMGVVATNLGIATSVGTIAGGLIGAAAGCVLGGTVGAALVPEFFLASGPAGCLVGMGLGIAVGSLVGAAALGIPAGIGTAIQVFGSQPPAATTVPDSAPADAQQ